MKVKLTGAGSFRVGKIVVQRGVETEVDPAAFEKLKPTVQGWFEIVGNGKKEKAPKEPKE